MTKKQSGQLKKVLTEAQNHSDKGDLIIYRYYRDYIQNLGLSKVDYERAIKQLKIALKV